jgi:hypothetical protein
LFKTVILNNLLSFIIISSKLNLKLLYVIEYFKQNINNIFEKLNYNCIQLLNLVLYTHLDGLLIFNNFFESYYKIYINTFYKYTINIIYNIIFNFYYKIFNFFFNLTTNIIKILPKVENTSKQDFEDNFLKKYNNLLKKNKKIINLFILKLNTINNNIKIKTFSNNNLKFKLNIFYFLNFKKITSITKYKYISKKSKVINFDFKNYF